MSTPLSSPAVPLASKKSRSTVSCSLQQLQQGDPRLGVSVCASLLLVLVLLVLGPAWVSILLLSWCSAVCAWRGPGRGQTLLSYIERITEQIKRRSLYLPMCYKFSN